MKIAIVSRTPLAASPWELYKALKKYTLHDVTLLNQICGYQDGRTFPYDVLLHPHNGAGLSALKSADLWHVHNYWIRELDNIAPKPPVLGQLHSLPRLGNWKLLIEKSDIAYTIKQPGQMKEYNIPGLPNLIDPQEYFPARRGEKVRIAFAPTTKRPPGSPDSKGYYEVKNILADVATERDIEIVWIEGKPYKENLKLKQSAHILIDDVVTGNWHRTSLEGACFGCAVINKVQKIPFVYANLDTLKDRLIWLIDDPVMMRDMQEQARLWVLQDWNALDLVKEYTRVYKRLAA